MYTLMKFLKEKFISLGIFVVNICIYLFTFSLHSSVLALDSLDNHNFVSDAVKNVAPSVVRIDTERLVERQPFDHFIRSFTSRFTR